MDDETLFLTVLFIGLLGVVFVLGIVSILSNSIASVLVDIGLPTDTASDIGSIFFAGMLLFIFLTIVRGVLD